MNLENFPTSESAKRMMSYLTQGFYDNSYVGKWIFEVMGREWDEVVEIFDSFPLQGFPQTCSWSLKYFEQKFGLEGKGTFEERKQALLQKITIFAPFTPDKIRKCIENLTGINMDMIQVLEYPAEFRFEIISCIGDNEEADLVSAKNYVSNIKPAHLIMLFIAEVVLNFELKIHTESQLKIKSDFRVLKHLILDGTWLLDGRRPLNSQELIRNRLRLNSSITEEIQIKNKFSVSSSVSITKSVNTDYRSISGIEHRREVGSRFNIGSRYYVDIETQEQLRIEKDLWVLNGTELLDGNKLLDAEIQEIVL